MRYEGRFFIEGEVIDACVEVEDGKVKEIKKSMDSCKPLKGIVLPGAIDLHVHFREPGFEEKEDFYTGTLSAAFGGVTFVADMPNNNPPIDTPERLADKISIVRKKANVDYTLYAMVSEHTSQYSFPNGMFKWYLYEKPEVSLPEDGFIVVHAELEDCIGNANSLRDYDYARPESCEVRAIRHLGKMGRKFHIAHISSRDSVDLCRIFGFTCEVTPHHLLLHSDMELGTFGKVNPPLRQKWMTEFLWEDLLGGRINIVASDHAPHTLDEKQEEFARAPPGLPEVETYVPIFLYLVKERKITLSRAVEVLMTNPGHLIGLKKGEIKKGYDADWIVVNFSEVRRVRSRDLHYKCGWTPYEGFPAIFPRDVFLRGERVIKDWELESERVGEFRPLPPSPGSWPSP